MLVECLTTLETNSLSRYSCTVSSNIMPDDYQADHTEAAAEDEGEWVVLEMKLIDWSFMDRSITVRVDNTTLENIKEVIKKWHGGKIKKLTLCKGSYVQMNELHHDNLTLKECGMDGCFNKANAPVVTLYYDFTPEGCEEPDPILMC